MSDIQKNQIPRPEYPRPQLERAQWMNLNGSWEFAFDESDSKREQGWEKKEHFDGQILVPFCPESKLSGLAHTDFTGAVWYKREVTFTKEQMKGRVLLHFGAVDYHCEAFINGQSAGSHDGGYTSFTFDITALVKEGANSITVYASDHPRTGAQPSGKQSHRYASYGCFYTRTTGIWQTVWLEFVPKTYLTRLETIPDPDNACVHIKAYTNQPANGRLRAEAYFAGKIVGRSEVRLSGSCTCFTVSLQEVKLWQPGDPNLYDLTFTLSGCDPEEDQVRSYFGLRKVDMDGCAIRISDRPVFQRLVLDQGFYPDGIYTAPTDEDLKKDIELSMALGFNGARMHEKVFEERYLYWADRLGYLVWGEFPNWGLDISKPDALATVLPQWIEEMQRDFCHPALVGWCPFNETWDYEGRKQDDRVLSGIYRVAKALDPTRPVIDTSGNFHVETDIFDVHDYEQDPEAFAKHYGKGQAPYNTLPDRQTYGGQPYFVSEYGGTWWNAEEAKRQKEALANGETPSGWGYGNRPLTEEEAGTRIAGLTRVLMDNPGMCALCYTQLTDVEQEQNGLYTYDRKPKFSDEVYNTIKEAFQAPAAIEQN